MTFKNKTISGNEDYQMGVLGHKIDREVRSVIAFEICNLKSFGSFLSHFLASTALAREKRGLWGHMIFELIRTFLPSCSRTNKSWTEVKMLASRILQVTLLIAESLRTFGMFCFLRDNGSVLFISLNYKTKLAVTSCIYASWVESTNWRR